MIRWASRIAVAGALLQIGCDTSHRRIPMRTLSASSVSMALFGALPLTTYTVAPGVLSERSARASPCGVTSRDGLGGLVPARRRREWDR
jgi:hypothetical protein